ncbi:23S rRNA (pseudouridine(1915)-N(3))-methyltransferase RlmH [Sulfuriroseicoccus oceanibius]|uniref:Ribosomal RNA large subunit methyltransferase H n=1 Tax=Sulfuriroseicoccus oceanibius TaxID=2707525 RepID=A0A6B3L7C6_9BACT|nr:23S rRNA (pseudouridine(1915)-N(3))-methyltransferase RlmH [Sulfuriroseicoccus oceanibius]QQL46293.1 23S rRNA (pseudouridine(1915)-N(3))-methyltransferase RlmH [Sulfuriroseicoccus oceanibius]
MNWKVIIAGKPALKFAKDGVADYEKRLRRFAKLEIVTVRDGSREDVSERLLKASEGCFRIALDERGASWTTMDFVEKVNAWEMRGVKTVALLIGASDGHTEELRKSCDLTLCLGTMTLQHEMALLILMEQIYRVYNIKAGTPYHRV